MMKHLFRKPADDTHAVPHTQMINPSQKRWLEWETGILLDAMDKNQHLSVTLLENNRTMQSVIIGFDVVRSTLLLDKLHPCSSDDIQYLQAYQAPLVLTILCGRGSNQFYYHLFARVTKVTASPNGFITEVVIDQTDVATTRRRDSRIHFGPGQGPVTELFTDIRPKITGRLMDLSHKGCQMMFYGGDDRHALQDKWMDLKIHFNSQFVVTLTGFVAQMRFYRSPCCHNRLRIIFTGANREDREQLREFVNTVVDQTRKTEITPYKAA